MIYLLAFLGWTLLWLMLLTDAKTKFNETFTFARWINDEWIKIAATFVATLVMLIFTGAVPDDKVMVIFGMEVNQNYFTAFSTGFGANGLLARFGSILQNIKKTTTPQ